MIYVLDSSAMLRYLDREAGAERVRDIIRSHRALQDSIAISVIQWGEIARMLFKRHDFYRANQVLARLRHLNFDLVQVTSDRAERAARIRIEKNIHYADAFAVELTHWYSGSILVTADFDFMKVEQDLRIEFLPSKTGIEVK